MRADELQAGDFFTHAEAPNTIFEVLERQEDIGIAYVVLTARFDPDQEESSVLALPPDLTVEKKDGF